MQRTESFSVILVAPRDEVDSKVSIELSRCREIVCQ